MSDRLDLIGGFRLYRGGREIDLPAGCRQIVAALGVRGAMNRDELARLLWPDSSHARAGSQLRTGLWRTGNRVPGLLVSDGDVLTLRRTANVDVKAFEAWASRVLADNGIEECELLATRGFVGELLPEWYADWVLIERQRLRQLRLHALEVAAHCLGRRGRHGSAIQIALEAIGLDPLRESAQRVLIGLHLAENNFAEAACQLSAFTDLLRAELGVDPSPLLTRLVSDHLAAGPQVATTVRGPRPVSRPRPPSPRCDTAPDARPP